METGGRIEHERAGREAVYFGPFALDLRTGELRKHGVRVRLQGKPFQILRALLERRGQLVTRDELRERLWSSNTFVDFESGLNTAVNRLRVTLGDSAEYPMYIETIARLGYRFIAPIALAKPPEGNAQLPPPETAAVQEESAEPSSDDPTGTSSRKRFQSSWLVAGAVIAAVVLISTVLVQRHGGKPPEFQQVTFEKGFASGARFIPGANGLVYSAAWNGGDSRIFVVTPGATQAQTTNQAEAWVAGFPHKGQIGFFRTDGEPKKVLLETEPLSGGVARVLSDRATDADWAPDGRLAVITHDASYYSIEYPPGESVYRSTVRLDNMRVAPAGDRIAFAEHPLPMDDAGTIMVVDTRTKQAHVLSPNWASIEGLAWYPSGREVWFTAAAAGVERELMAVALNGRARTVAQMPGGMELLDIDASGRVLIDRNAQHMSMIAGVMDRGDQDDISWLDWSSAAAVSNDNSVLFDESGSGGGAGYSIYLRHAGSDTPARIGHGRAMDLSSDCRWALAGDARDPTKLSIISTRDGGSQPVNGHRMRYRWAKFIPGKFAILFSGARPEEPPALYTQRLPDGPPVLISPDASADRMVLSSDGQFAAGYKGSGQITIVDLARHSERILPVDDGEHPVAFSGDDAVLVSEVKKREILVKRLDLVTGQLTPYSRIPTPDRTGIVTTFPVIISPNLRFYAYSRLQSLSNLYIVSGWK